MPMKRPLISVAPFVLALWRRKSSSTCTTTIPVTLQSRSRMSHLAAHHADELVVLQGLADLHLCRHEMKAPQNPVARLRGCPSRSFSLPDLLVRRRDHGHLANLRGDRAAGLHWHSTGAASLAAPVSRAGWEQAWRSTMSLGRSNSWQMIGTVWMRSQKVQNWGWEGFRWVVIKMSGLHMAWIGEGFMWKVQIRGGRVQSSKEFRLGFRLGGRVRRTCLARPQLPQRQTAQRLCKLLPTHFGSHYCRV